MTQARLLTTPPEGHGITGRILDRTYAELTSGRNLGEQMLMVGIAVPCGTSQRRTAKGIKRFVTYEFLRLEPILDPAIQEEIRFALVTAYERRTSRGKQMPLEFEGAPELERRREIFAALEEWRDDQDVPVTPSELTDMWRDYVQPVEGATVPALAHAPTADILAFAYHLGAIMPEHLIGMTPIPEAGEGMPSAVRPVPEAMFDDGTGDAEQEQAEQEDSIEAVAAEAADARAANRLAAVPD
jgi:hypothetical protein